jgi:hypothetical protein
MPDSGLPPDLEQFIVAYMRSIEHLEVLLAVASQANNSLSPETVFHDVRSSINSVRERLDELVTDGLVIRDEAGYRFAPQSEQTRSLVQQLGKAYKERRVRVIQAVYSDRRRGMREISDAFRFRRKEKNG